MTDEELKENWEDLLNIYKGILFNNPSFELGTTDKILYDFSSPKLNRLKEIYHLEEIASEGSDLDRALRLLGFFSPRITHKGDFINHIGCNAIDLLEYCLDKPEKGINCLNKSKILQECCLSLGIYARRIWMMPYSPYDCDNHVVNEIYDFNLKKWIMLDMTSNGYFVNKKGLPLSVLEIRNNFASNEICEFKMVSCKNEKFFTNLEMECLYYKQYFAKNLFYFYSEAVCGFGNNNQRFVFIPLNFNLEKNVRQKQLFSKNEIPPISDINTLLNPPIAIS